MYGLAPTACSHFFSSEPEGSVAGAATMTQNSGLGKVAALIDGEVDDYLFAHCGYSCNIHSKSGAYAMVHVTPQEECSYASFETNFGSARSSLGQEKVSTTLGALVNQVLEVFQPSNFTITLFSDQ